MRWVGSFRLVFMAQNTRVVFYREKSGRVPMQRWIDRLPETPRRKCEELIRQLQESGRQLKYPRAHPLREGIHELRARHGTVRYRILYFWHGSTIAIITHGIVKKSRAVPDTEIQRALRRKRDFEQDPTIHTQEI